MRVLTAGVLLPADPGGMLPARVAVNVIVAAPVELPAVMFTEIWPEAFVVALDVETDIALGLLLLIAIGTPTAAAPPAVTVSV